MSPAVRRFVLTLHLVSSLGWLGAIVAYLGLVIAGLLDQRQQTVSSAYFAMETIGWYVIVPLAALSLITGIVQSIGTVWGLLRHYWVVFKLILTVIAVAVLLLNMPTVSSLAAEVSRSAQSDVSGLWSQLLHAVAGLLLLLTATILGIYKPKGVTPFGRRADRSLKRSGPVDHS